jgi:hypothetical protein
LLGDIFEFYAHQVLSAGGTFSIRNLKRSSDKVTQLAVSSKTVKVTNTFEPETDGNFYCHPEKHNFPGVDAWDTDTGFYQMTVAEMHEITWRVS